MYYLHTTTVCNADKPKALLSLRSRKTLSGHNTPGCYAHQPHRPSRQRSQQPWKNITLLQCLDLDLSLRQTTLTVDPRTISNSRSVSIKRISLGGARENTNDPSRPLPTVLQDWYRSETAVAIDVHTMHRQTTEARGVGQQVIPADDRQREGGACRGRGQINEWQQSRAQRALRWRSLRWTQLWRWL